MSESILVYFEDKGAPASSLSATIRIRDLSDHSLVVNSATMTEVGDGFYEYTFTAYDNTKEYTFRADGSSSLGNLDRYAPGANDTGQIDAMISNGITRSGDIITILNEASTSTWRQYDLSDGGRIKQ